jgi:FkbM family methyltransferase
MMSTADTSAYGTHAPNWLDRLVLGVTRSLPANWLGLRLAILVRRITLMRLGEGALDIVLWGIRLRLYPRRNGCEKNALFTPQMFDILERQALASAIDERLAGGGTFSFIDIGANVGLYALFVATRAGPRARILAIEPQAALVDRLRYNLRSNPQLNIEVLSIAVADRDGELPLLIDRRDSGGTRMLRDAGPPATAAPLLVPCRPLTAILAERGFSAIDALKIDIEGAEDIALTPFLRDAPAHLLPRMILIEDSRAGWKVDLFGLLGDRDYKVIGRSRHNVILRRAQHD